MKDGNINVGICVSCFRFDSSSSVSIASVVTHRYANEFETKMVWKQSFDFDVFVVVVIKHQNLNRGAQDRRFAHAEYESESAWNRLNNILFIPTKIALQGIFDMSSVAFERYEIMYREPIAINHYH